MTRRAPMPEHPNDTQSLQAYPNLRAAAEILGVAASTLSRRQDLAAQHRGERDVVVSPGEVLRLGAIYRKRSLNDVAEALLAHARAVAPQEERRIEQEVEAFFEATAPSADQRTELMVLARRLLPAPLCEQIEEVLGQRGDELPDAIQGYPPPPDD
jgi:hypothetical protein